MRDKHYPTVSIEFIDSQILREDRTPIVNCVKNKKTTYYIVNGTKALFKRTYLVREVEAGEICFEQAMALAIHFRFLHEISIWLEQNRNFKEGAYIDTDK